MLLSRLCFAQRYTLIGRQLVCAVLALLTAGCALPSQQLSLPGIITGATSTSPLDSNNRKGGVPSSDPADPETFGPRIYDGDGQLIGAPSPSPLSQGTERTRHSVDKNGVTLSLVGASVSEVAKAVLGDILGLNYVVSDKVKASITLHTSRPIPPNDLLQVFESVLRSEGAAIVVEGGTYHIVPADSGTLARAPARWRNKGGQKNVGLGSEIIPLRYVSAAEMERVLKSVAPDTSISKIDETRNLLMVSGTQTELNSVRDAVSIFDVDWMQGMSFALLPVESADPESIAKELDTIFSNDKNGPAKGVVRFVPNKRLKSVLVISSQPEYLRKAEGWIRRIDLAGQATEKRVFVYHVQHRPAGELAGLLRKVYKRNQDQAEPDAAATEPQEAQTVFSSPEVGQTSGNPAITNSQTIIPSSFGALQNPPGSGGDNAASSDSEAQTQENQIETGSIKTNELPTDQTSGINIVADDPNNSLVITATHNEYVRMRHILSRIDVAPNQVLLEATIAEVSLNDQLRYGLRWFFQNGDHGFRLTDSALGTVAPVFPGFSYFLNMPNVQVALDALSDVTDVNVVSSPSLMVLDNKRAVLQVGAEVPIATQSAVSVAAPGAPIVNSISFRNTGVILGITPRVSDDGRVLLDIEQEVSDVVATTSSTLDSPTIQQRRIRTTVTVADGESIVLAGFMQDRATVGKSGVPLLDKIPVLGNAFKSKDNQVERTELFIAITPQVVRDHNQIRSIANEFRDRMNFTTRPQRSGPPDRREDIDRFIVR